MKLPETQNANHLYAFKKGYRVAMEGKSLALMPSQIKLDDTMKAHFESGWHQYQEDIAEALENENDSPWRNKAIWTVMAIIAGLATAGVMIHNIQQEKQTNKPQKVTPESVNANIPQKAPLAQQLQAHHPEDFSLITTAQNEKAKQNTPPIKKKEAIISSPDHKETDNSLSLLSHDERKDLELSRQEASPKSIQIEAPLVQSSIQVSKAVFTTEITSKEPGKIYTNVIPKFVRKLYFFTQIQMTKDSVLYHRWRYKGQIMATIPLQVKEGNFRTWSSKRLSSAWSGPWVVEILNSKKQPIYRKTFTYSQ